MTEKKKKPAKKKDSIKKVEVKKKKVNLKMKTKDGKTVNVKATKTEEKKDTTRPYNKFLFTKEEVEQALEDSWGNVAKAARSMRNPDGSEVDRCTLDLAIGRMGIKYFSDSVKGKIAKAAFDVLQDKAINERDTKCIVKLLDTWGKHVDFTEPDKKVDLNLSLDPWGELLNTIDPQRNKDDSVQAESN